MVHHVQLLVNDTDTGCLGICNVCEIDFFAEVFNSTAVPLMDAAQHLDQRGLTGAVFTHERMDFTGLQLEINALQRMDAGEIFLNALHFQNCFTHTNNTFLIK